MIRLISVFLSVVMVKGWGCGKVAGAKGDEIVDEAEAAMECGWGGAVKCGVECGGGRWGKVGWVGGGWWAKGEADMIGGLQRGISK